MKTRVKASGWALRAMSKATANSFVHGNAHDDLLACPHCPNAVWHWPETGQASGLLLVAETGTALTSDRALDGIKHVVNGVV